MTIVRIEFAHTADDFAESRRARSSRRRAPLRRVILALLGLGDGTDLVAERDELLRARGLLIGSGGLLTVGTACVYLALHVSLGWLVPAIGVFGFLLLILAGAFAGGMGLGVRRRFASDPHNSDPAVFEADETGIRLIARRARSDVDWSSVRELYESPNLFVIADDTPSSFIIPKRAFADDRARDQFRQFVTERCGQPMA
jgi:hypothetical protein